MELTLGIDLGTSYFKLGLFDRECKCFGLSGVSVKKDIGSGVLYELAIDRFWKLLQNGLKDVCKQAKVEPAEIKAIGYSSQANSFILLDKSDLPLTPIILWPDERSKRIYPEVKQLWQRDDFLQITGLGIDCSNQLCINKLLWFKKNQPDTWGKTNRIMTISDYLTFSLTGQYAGDAGTASLLGLLDLQKLKWWDKAFDILGIDGSILSKPLCPGTVAGNICKSGQELLGLKTAMPFVVGSLDHHVAAIGAGVGQVADMSESTGTVLACVNFTKKYNPKKNICIGPGLKKNNFYRFAFNENGASGLEWYQKKYAPDLSIEQLVQMAEKVKPGCDSLVALPLANKYEKLTGFKNRTDKHSHGHFVRAIMESTAKSLAELVNELCKEGKPKQIVATGGGAKSDLWLQIKADMLGAEFITTNCDEPACKGAAMLAATAAGWRYCQR